MKLLEKVGRRHSRARSKDPALLAKTTPDYTVGCKRILPSNDVVSGARRARTSSSSPTAWRGARRTRSCWPPRRELEVDALVFGTGFQVLDMPVGRMVRGRDGRTLAEVWDGSPRAHLGATVPGFPNLFILLGPNTGLGHSSMVYMIESQIAYVLDALRTMRSRGAATPRCGPRWRPRYNAEVQRRMQGTVWNTGCASWYQDAQGNNPTLWPDWTWRFRRRTASSTPRGVRARMSVIITGAAGGIGSATVERCARTGARSSASTCRRRPRVRRARPGLGRRGGGRRDRAARRPRRADQQRRPRHAAERVAPARRGRAGRARREPPRPVAGDLARRCPRCASRAGAWSTSRAASRT